MKNRPVLQKGFTLIELIVAIAILTILITLATINLAKSQRTNTLDGAMQQVTSDFQGQQVKAMVGDTEGRSVPDAYGIYCNGTSYVLFHGASYNPSDSSNFTVPLDSSLQFTATSTVIFSRVSGEVSGYNNAANTIVIQDTTNNATETAQFNALGVITNVY